MLYYTYTYTYTYNESWMLELDLLDWICEYNIHSFIHLKWQ